ncbi:MAG: discoidin domain-containing protein, partial [Planctomycetota bacterium]
MIDQTVTAICAAVDGPGHESQGNNSMDITGGSFTTVGDWSVAKKGSATVNISGGTIDIGDDLNIGPKAGEMTFNMTGGVINAAGSLIVARKGGAIATFNMYGGALSCADFSIAPQDTDTVGVASLYGGTINTGAIAIATEGGTGLLDLQGGTLVINGDARDVVTEYINSGKIVGYGGANAVSLTYDEGAGTTAVVATEAALASDPSPANGETDAPHDVVLSWTPGGSAGQHDVYFGTSFDDVNNATNMDPMGPDKVYRARQSISSDVVPETLDFGQSYYWRGDEGDVAAARWDRGDVWKFTAEPFAYPVAVENIAATASSKDADDVGPENTVNAAGLDATGLLHTRDFEGTMWWSSSEPDGAWIEYEFDKAYKLDQMWVWNYNGVGLNVAYGLKNVTIEHSADGINYAILGGTHEFLIAPGADDYAHNTTVDFGGAVAKYVKITANSNWSNGITDQYGLSEVRFFHIPLRARKPSPDSGATDVDLEVVLSFRAGRQAAEHNVYFSLDEQAVIDGTAYVDTVNQTSYDAGTLELGRTYYWRIDEVNNLETPATWQGDIWNFATPEYLVVDDFEAYNDLNPDDPDSNRIFLTWIGGDDVLANGSQVGHYGLPFAEQTIVNGGAQSMPLYYDNDFKHSEAERALSPPQDWAENGIGALTLWFHGDPNNTAEQMYVKVNGSRVEYDGSADDIKQASWQQWDIDLALFGVDLANVTKLAIGFGDETNLTPGGAGIVY